MKETPFNILLKLLKSSKMLVLIVFISALLLGYFISIQDPFLNTWDEQFHALVAKNLSSNMLTPELYKNPTLQYDYKSWVGNNIWLHKQPLFLWQIALSIKLFGISELAVRLPSIFMHAITSLFIFSIGNKMTNKYVGFFSALLFSFSYYQLELIVGKHSTDHNDIAFLFYCTGSFWAWFNYKSSHKKNWLIIMGLFSGGAVLNKWLMGLIVYIIWGGIKLFNERKTLLKRQSLIELILPLSISICTFLPWQLYILNHYPKESSHEFNYNSRHIFEAIESHTGPWYFHFDKGIKELYGDGIIVPFIIIIGLIILSISLKNKEHRSFLIINIVFTYSFFSLAATKMISYPLIASPFIFIAFGNLIYRTSTLLTSSLQKSIFAIIIIPLSCYGILSPQKIKYNHLPENNRAKYQEKRIIDSLDNHLKGNNYVLFNMDTTPFGNISVMFFTNYECYNYIPTQLEISLIKQRGLKVACIDNNDLPMYITNDKTIILIK